MKRRTTPDSIFSGDITAILRGELCVRLRNACTEHQIKIAESLAHLRGICGGFLFVDPAIVDSDELLALTNVHAINASRVVLYTRLSSPAVARGIAKLSLGGICHLILADMEDSPEQLRNALELSSMNNARLPVVRQLAPNLLVAPPRLALALTKEFLGSTTGAASKQLAAAAGMDRRSVERWLSRIGLAPPKIALSAAHLIRAFPALKDPWVPLHVVATEYGFLSVRTLTRQCKLVFGLSPWAVRASVRPEDVPKIIRRRLRTRDRRLATSGIRTCRKMARD